MKHYVRCSTSCREIISTLPEIPGILDIRDVCVIFHNLQKVNVSEKDIQNPKFQKLLKKSESLISQMTASKLANIATDIMIHKLLIENKINGKIKDALMLKINEVPFERMLFLDFVIFKSKSIKTILSNVQEMFLEKVELFFTYYSNIIGTFVNIAGYMARHVKIVHSDFLEQFSN